MYITAFYASILAITQIYLSSQVIKARSKYGIAMGDGGNINLQTKIRAHSNFCEYTPIFLILLLCQELTITHPVILHLFGIAYVVGRVLHAYSLTINETYAGYKLTNNPKYRIISMMITLNVLGFQAFNLLLKLLISAF